MKTLIVLLFTLATVALHAQQVKCNFNKPFITIHFGKGDNVQDLNGTNYNYTRVQNYCPQDGHYSYLSRTSDCFGGDWLTIPEDHTPGDVDGNMMVINASYRSGKFFNTPIKGLKPNTIYEFGVWMMNVCLPSDKCPYPLLPDLTLRLQDAEGKIVMQIGTGEIKRYESPSWKQYRGIFTTPETGQEIMLTMLNANPGGCGNDFAIDDITFRECIKVNTVAAKPKANPPATKPATTTTTTVKPPVPKPTTTQKSTAATKPAAKKPAPAVTQKQAESKPIAKTETPARNTESVTAKKQITVLPPAPKILTTRSNPLVKQFEMDAGEIQVDLYDNGQIDGDTVSIYHNNTLIVSKARLSQQPISFKINVDADKPHHEIVMVAENLGSIPPNTSVMIVRAGDKKYEVFISSSEEKNAKVVFNLRQ